MNDLNQLLFGVYPYIAFSIFLLGSLVRYDREQYTWKSNSSQLLESKQLRRGSIPFHIGILTVLGGHFVGLLTPLEVWEFLGVPISLKQKAAMLLGGVFGLLCLYGLIILLIRRFTNERIWATTSTMDAVILVMLFIQLCLGLSTIFVSAEHLDGSEMLKLIHWAQGIVTFHSLDAAQSISSVHLIFKLHVFFGLSIFVAFPFSRLVHIWSVPVKYATRSYQVVRTRTRA